MQDVHEFWTVLCERLEKELHGTSHASLVEGLFQGKQRDYVRCCTCERRSFLNDAFQDLKLAVPSDDAAAKAAAAAGDVPAALRELLSPEDMRGDEQYACDVCDAKTDAQRGVQLLSLPPVLTLQLKRFRFDYKSFTRAKVNTPLSFPLELPMDEFVDATAEGAQPPQAPYELYAVLVHSGSASFGHYYALVRGGRGGPSGAWGGSGRRVPGRGEQRAGWGGVRRRSVAARAL